MNFLISVLDEPTYEHGVDYTYFEANATFQQLFDLLNALDVYIDDYPHYHCRLRNDNGDFIFICITVKE